MSFRYSILGALVIVASTLVTSPVSAQDSPLSLEARTGVTFPLGDLSDAGAESGLIFGVDAFYSTTRTLSLYAGWGYHQFSNDVSVSGPRAGVKLLFPMPGDATPWARGGLTFNQAKGLGASADVASDRGLGFELGAGIDYLLSPQFGLTPALRYHSFTADYGADNTSISYMTLDLGAHLHF